MISAPAHTRRSREEEEEVGGGGGGLVGGKEVGEGFEVSSAIKVL